jgi:bifunctional non-homologous end joining protein LigD
MLLLRPAGDGWSIDDGYRVAVQIERGKVHMLTGHANDWTARFRPIANVLATPKPKAAYLDGKITVLTQQSFSDLGGV